MQDPLPEPCLFGYWRSSAAYRVRITLNLKRIAARHVSVRLQLGEQESDEHRARNPAGLVPVWRDPDGFTLAQSLAIIDYLDEIYPDPPLLPNDPRQKALCREIAYTIACDIHPVNNLRVNQYLKHAYHADADAQTALQQHWIATGFAALDAMLAVSRQPGRYCHGDQPTLADICLDPHNTDPSRISARIIRANAEQLSKVTINVENTNHEPETVSLFLMRFLFTMFAQSIELLPLYSFCDVLKKCVDYPSLLSHRVDHLCADVLAAVTEIDRDLQQLIAAFVRGSRTIEAPATEPNVMGAEPEHTPSDDEEAEEMAGAQ